MATHKACALLSLAVTALGQQAGTVTAESHPSFTIEECKTAGGCTPLQGEITLDMQWRWLHEAAGYKNCMGKSEWDPALCPDPETCSKSCALDGLDPDGYTQTYGIKEISGGVQLRYRSPEGTYANRVYLLEDENKYRMFKLKNREFTFTVDVSRLPCGMNGALYFVEMPQNGGYDGVLNGAGAKYGTGYCDAQCPRMKFVKNLANMEGMETHFVNDPEDIPTEVGPDGKWGACCAEMDIFEGNSRASSYTAHPCDNPGTLRCEGEKECGNKDKGWMSSCDKDGCGFNAYQLGQTDFYGDGADFKVDTSKPLTIVTQFITTDGTDFGDLAEIRRIFIQDGKVINNVDATNVNGGGDSITDSFCDATAKAFNDTKSKKPDSYMFMKRGGLKAMGEALERGMVLTMSIWDDSLFRMLWLDAEKPFIDLDPQNPGVSRGPCSFDSGHSKDLKKKHRDAYVTYTNVKYGEIDSTYTAAGGFMVKSQARPDALEVLASKSSLTSAAAMLGAGAVAAAFVLLMTVRLGNVRRALLPLGREDARLLTSEPSVPMEEGM